MRVYLPSWPHTHSHRATFIFFFIYIFNSSSHSHSLQKRKNGRKAICSNILFFLFFALPCSDTWRLCVRVYVALCLTLHFTQHSTQPKYFIYLTFTLFEIKICLWRTAQFHLFSSLPQNIWLRLCECFHLVGMCVRFFCTRIHNTSILFHFKPIQSNLFHFAQFHSVHAFQAHHVSYFTCPSIRGKWIFVALIGELFLKHHKNGLRGTASALQP